MRSDDDLALALEDARARQKAVLSLIFSADHQAISLLGIYLTLGTATATGAATAHVAGEDYFLVAVALSVMTIALSVGSVFCFLTMRRANIANPGRDADFWLWAIEHDAVDRFTAVKQHLNDLQADLVFNRGVNATSAAYLGAAKLIGVATPVLGGLAAVLWWAAPVILPSS